MRPMVGGQPGAERQREPKSRAERQNEHIREFNSDTDSRQTAWKAKFASLKICKSDALFRHKIARQGWIASQPPDLRVYYLHPPRMREFHFNV